MINVNIRQNNNNWGVFNEESNVNINFNNPINEQQKVDNNAKKDKKDLNLEYNEKILNKNTPQIFKKNNYDDIKSFAQVQIIDDNGNVHDISNNNNNKNNNKKTVTPQVQKPIAHTFHKEFNDIFPNKNFNKKQTFQNNVHEKKIKIKDNQDFIPDFNITQQKQFVRQYTVPNNPSNHIISNNAFTQPDLPTMSQMETYCKEKSDTLNEFY
jgi:hypothetical protein